MGITCSLYRATEEEIQHLPDEPDAVASFLDADAASGPPVRRVRPKGLRGLLLRLLPIEVSEVTSKPDDAVRVPVTDPERTIDIDKGWHGLHFLFTGTADAGEEPACYLLRGGEELDDEGRTHALMPNQVRRFNEYLSGITRDELMRRYDPERMARLKIYPDVIWTRPASSGDSPLHWLLACFSDLQRFIQRTAANNHGVIIDIE